MAKNTDRSIAANEADIVVHGKKEKHNLIDAAIPDDANLLKKKEKSDDQDPVIRAVLVITVQCLDWTLATSLGVGLIYYTPDFFKKCFREKRIHPKTVLSAK